MKLAFNSLLVALISTVLVAQTKQQAFPSQIKHVVVIFQENRTPDNLFHFLTPACPIPQGASGLNACTPSPVTNQCYDISPCGLSNESGAVLPVTLTALPLAGDNGGSHAHTAFEQMCDHDPANAYACRNDGAWQIKSDDTVYAYVDNAAVVNYDHSPGHLLDPYLTFAKQYGWGNFMYQTNQGPSYPAHQFMFSGTSARSTADDLASTFISENFKPKGSSSGCLAGPDATSNQVSPLLPGQDPCPGGTLFDGGSAQECKITNSALVYPTNPVGSFCTNKPNMGQVLDNKSVSWKYYAPSPGSIWTAPNSIQNICVPAFTSSTTLQCTGAEWIAKVDLAFKGADVLNDIANCNLASVSWVIPNGDWSDHPGKNNQYGPSWVTAVINAIGENPPCASGIDNGETLWNDTAIVVTWDDWGGWSDNQPPPILSALPCTSSDCQGDYQYGFRVPLLIVSAYTPVGYINNATHDFGSILRMIESIFNIQQGKLGVADARATNNLSNFFQPGTTARSYTHVPAVKPGSYFLGAAQNGAATAPDDDGDDN